MRFLGIETSCDETAAAIVERQADGAGHILSNAVFSQIEDHKIFGGVVPEIAARAHVAMLDKMVAEATDDAGIALNDLDGIAVTAGPGLVGGLLVGVMHAKALAWALEKPLYAVNHLEGHALTARLTNQTPFPFLLLLVSGGHSQILLVKDVGEYERWGTTIDDALGEAFDKTAKLLGLDYPGGPEVQKWAAKGDAKRFDLPRPLPRSKDGAHTLNFSFSGLKTAMRQRAEAAAPISDQDIADLCAGFQSAVTGCLRDRIERALVRFKTLYPDIAPQLVAAGGVAANSAIRAMLNEIMATHEGVFIAPPLNLCTDNGAMIAWAGLERAAKGFEPDTLDFMPRSRWPLDEEAQAVISFGKRGQKA